MDTIWIIVIAVAAIIVIAGVAWWLYQRGADGDRKLKKRFGDEYDRTVRRTGDEESARRDLSERLERREQFDIRELDEDEKRRYANDWEDVQHRFVDEPESAVRDADRLIQDVMRTRGYPVEDFEQRARDLSVDHPDVVEHYREARQLLNSGERVPTENHREAMLHFRALYERLVGATVEPGQRQN